MNKNQSFFIAEEICPFQEKPDTVYYRCFICLYIYLDQTENTFFNLFFRNVTNLLLSAKIHFKSLKYFDVKGFGPKVNMISINCVKSK